LFAFNHYSVYNYLFGCEAENGLLPLHLSFALFERYSFGDLETVALKATAV
jgi:hypothetical protein